MNCGAAESVHGRSGMTKCKMKKIVGNIIVFLVSMLLFLIAFELYLRINPVKPDFYAEDTLIDWKLKPNIAGTYATKEFSASYQFNAEGFNDENHQVKKGNGTFRIAIIGDSFVEGLQVAFSGKFSQLLEARLQQKGLHAEVLDFGISSTGTTSQYLILKNYALKYDPDLVVLVFFAGNDLAENDPAFDYDTGVLSKEKTYAFIEDDSLVFKKINMRENENIRIKIGRYCKSCNFFYSRMKNILAGKRIVKEPYPRNYYAFTDEDEMFAGSWKITEKMLLQMQQELQERNSTLAVVSLPSFFQVNNLENELRQRYTLPENTSIDFHRADKRLASACAANNISCTFLLDDFTAYTQKSDGPLYFAIDGHLTEKGHALAALLIERFIFENDLLAAEDGK